jgi:hypothetical protein
MAGSPRPGTVTSSKDVEKFQAQIRKQAEFHNSIVNGVAECAKGINGLVAEGENLPIPQAARDALDLLLGGLGQILQGISDIHFAEAENFTIQADRLTEAIKELRQQESGIIVARLERKN